MYDIEQLETAMLEQGLDIFNLSKKIGRSDATVRQLFKRGSGHAATVKEIADALGVPMKKIIKKKTRKRVA